jgi:ferredoxin
MGRYAEMAFEFACDYDQCLNCGACMDLCPPQCLDMTRPRAGAEGDLDPRGSMPWMMALPVQTSKCTGCGVCEVECPVNAITIAESDQPVIFDQPQGLLFPAAPADDSHWVPLSAVTHETLRRVKPDPWGSLYRWKPRLSRRPSHTTGRPTT